MSEEGKLSRRDQRAPEDVAAQKRERMRRRDFLQAGLVGAGATLGLKGAAEAQTASARPRGCEVPDPPPAPPAETGALDPAVETWQEPWVWRPGEWPGQQLDLNVVEYENAGPAVTLGNPNAVLFSYGANTPGPTIRMKGDETLHVKLRNLLGEDSSDTFVGPYPDPAAGGRPPGLSACEINDAAEALGNKRRDFCLGEHTNGVHAVRVTNLHTHGLHVSPSRNSNGTHSDNVILRVLSQADFRRREEIVDSAPCDFMSNPDELYLFRDDEQAGEADYEFRLGDVQRRRRERENARRAREGKKPIPPQPHPAGTFWYHPHCHGATWDQVSSGMAGYLIVEGDIDEAVNRALTGVPDPDPEVKTGPYDYRERLMFMQRVLFSNRSKDPNSESKSLRAGATPLVNGNNDPAVISMRPGAVERWRVINGSVDGRGFKRFMVVHGMYVVRGRRLYRATPVAKKVTNDTTGQTSTVVVGDIGPDPIDPVLDVETLEGGKQRLQQLSVDGVTLLEKTLGLPWESDYRYTIKDLSRVDAGPNPLARPDADYASRLTRQVEKECGTSTLAPPQEDAIGWLSRLNNVWSAGNNRRGKRHIKDCFVRPNEFYMGPANRTDVFFTAPPKRPRADVTVPTTVQPDPCKPPATVERSYDVYTVLAKAVVVHSDTPEQAKQTILKPNGRSIPPVPFPEDIVLAHVFVDRDRPVSCTRDDAPVECADDPVRDLALPALREVPVQDYLQPIDDRELEVSEEERRARGLGRDDKRTRIVTYSGWGNADFPLVSTYPTDPSRPGLTRFARDNPSLDKLVYADHGGRGADGEPYKVLLPPNIRTMAIKFNNARIAEEREAGEKAHVDPFALRHPHHPRKFSPNDPYRARMAEDTAEEWVLYNLTDLLWGNTTTARKTDADPHDENNDPRSKDYKQPPTQYREHYVSHPISRREGNESFLDNLDFQVVTKGIDHPFHIHQNPFWVTRIEIPDDEGNLHNILDEPRWMDTIWIPRHRGRVVFRTRFPDYVGAYVHHCHILLHEDNGMMHVIEATPFADQANYQPQPRVADNDMEPEEVSEIYPRPDRHRSYFESTRFFDPSRGTGQLYPGFDVRPPKLEDDDSY